jgi:hypothetical protein
MNRRIHCPYHKERTPSCVLYVDHYVCYGCGARGALSDLGEAPAEVAAPEPENLARSLAHIEALPLREVRGLLLPSDERSYYIVWPERNYYKRRFLTSHGSKYVGAAGHKKPWFWVRREGAACVVIEGEINALSIAEACPDLAVVSPGGAGDFSSKTAKRELQSLVHFSTILIIADADAPGAKAVIDLYGELAGRVPTKTLLMPTDANEVLQHSGKEALRQEIERAMGSALEAGA